MPHDVIMPALGMVQDTGLIVAWHKKPGDAVTATDVLFEVETDKATMEVEAGAGGFVAALLAEAGQEIPIGDVIAVISEEKPENPVQENTAVKAADGSEPTAPKAIEEPAKSAAVPQVAPKLGPQKSPAPVSKGKILASPKARRLALEQGLDLGRLAANGVTMPYHAADLETLRAMPSAASVMSAPIHVTARVSAESYDSFANFIDDEVADCVVWAAFAAASLRMASGTDTISVRLDQPLSGSAFSYTDPDQQALSAVEPKENDTAPNLVLRDLTNSRITGGTLGHIQVPVVTITRDRDDFVVTLAFTPNWLGDDAAAAFVDGLAARIEQPLRHLL